LLTKRGKALEKVIGREMDRLSERALASLEPDERTALVELLNRVWRNLS
jgi:DNA-binding MarR family transcriptional regulator